MSDLLVPACAKLCSSEPVLARLAWRNGTCKTKSIKSVRASHAVKSLLTFSNARHTILLTRVELSESVPMNTGAVMLKIVLDLLDIVRKCHVPRSGRPSMLEGDYEH
jgi:hypothetical protein